MNATLNTTTVAHIIMDKVKIDVNIVDAEPVKSTSAVIRLVGSNIVRGYPCQIFNGNDLILDCNYVIGNNEKIQYTDHDTKHTYVISAKEFRDVIQYNKFVEFMCDPEGNALLEPVANLLNALDMLEYYTRTNHKRKSKGFILEPVLADILHSGDIKIPRITDLDVKVTKKGNDLILRLGLRVKTSKYTDKLGNKMDVTLNDLKDLLEQYNFANYMNHGIIEKFELQGNTHQHVRYCWKYVVSK